MNHAFLILAHQYPEHLLRLVTALNSPHSFFYIHVDKKNEIFMDAKEVKQLLSYPNVKFVERIEVYWGGFSQVKATLILLKTAMENPAIDYFHLLSGVDYPLKSTANIHSFFQNNKHDYLTYVPDEKCYCYWLERYYFYDSKYIDARNGNKSLIQKTIGLLLIFLQRICAFAVMKLHWRIRKPIPLDYYHGSQWFSLTRSSVEYILSYVRQNPWILKRFEYTAVSDESFFIMILMNNPKLRAKIVNNDLRLRRPDGMPFRGGDPLDEKDFERIKQSSALWGRKFVPGVSDKLIALIEEQIRH